MLRQVRCKVGDLVGVELLRRHTQLIAAHRRDQRIADCIGNFDQYLAIMLGFDKVPYQQALFNGQGFQNIRDVGRVHAGQLALQLSVVLFVRYGIQQNVTVVARQFLPMDDLLQQGMLVQQRFHLLQVFLHILGVVMFLVAVGHRAFPLNRGLL